MDARYLVSSTTPENLPPLGAPEVCFIGRSNCGKSSLLNALMQKQGLARTSRTPGRTQMINFFEAQPADIRLVDLPGYGFSATQRSERDSWPKLMEAYFRRTVIKQCLFLADARREFVDEDWELLSWLRSLHPVSIALTKVDKITNRQLSERTRILNKELVERDLKVEAIFLTSVLKKVGIAEAQIALGLKTRVLH